MWGRSKIIERIGPVAYRLELPEKLRSNHNMFLVSNLKKCLADENLVIPLEEIQLDDKLHFIEEPVEIMDREVKRLKRVVSLLLRSPFDSTDHATKGEEPHRKITQYSVDKQCFEIQKKQFLIKNDRLLDQIISQDIVNIGVNSSLDINTSMNVNSSIAMNDSVNYVKMCNKSKLQEKDTTIEKLKANIKRLNKTSTTNSVKKDIDETETINKELEHKVTKLIAENEHLKQTYKKLYDLIKPSRVQAKEHAESLVNQLNQKYVEVTDLNAQLQEKVFVIIAFKNDHRKFKGKDIVDNVAHASNATTIAPGMYKLDPVTLAHTGPNIYKPSKKLVDVMPINKKKTVRSKSTDNTKNDRILQISSSTQKKNKVEDHSRIVKSCLNKPICIVEPAGIANVQYSKLNTNSELTCVKCNSSMFDAKHELCFLEFVSDMNASSKSKSVKKAKKKEEWKPTGKVFTKIGYNWRPTGRTFTLVRNACPLTRITATNKVPLREPIPLEVIAQESVVTKVYTRRPKVPKTNGSNSKPKIAKSVISNKTEPDTSRGSNTSVAPSSSSSFDLTKFFCGFGTSDAQST
ncbi:hypothetical protein Tco_0111275 [Tanacetum coccineum]